MDRELLKGSTPLLLLSLLREGPLYGYQIIQTVRERTQGQYSLKEGALYPALHRLEASGCIQSYWQTQASGRDRRYYVLLPEGEAQLALRRMEWGRFVGMINGFLEPADPA